MYIRRMKHRLNQVQVCLNVGDLNSCDVYSKIAKIYFFILLKVAILLLIKQLPQ